MTEIFPATVRIIAENSTLAELTKKAIRNTVVCPEDSIYKKRFNYDDTLFWIDDTLTLMAARKMKSRVKKVAVLNFANPFEPGLGIIPGSQTQEEYLCRASNLYFILSSKQASAFYEHHNALLEARTLPGIFLASDLVILSKNVTVIRDDVGYEKTGTGESDNEACFSQVYTKDWYEIDVLTCAAPDVYNENDIRKIHLEDVFIRRVRNILEVAIENEDDGLVLGAFGCGSFNNSPIIVASAFRKVFEEKRYRNCFQEVAFAIKGGGKNCVNIEAFRGIFDNMIN